MMNLTTALAWSCYFFGLSHLEPSIVNTLHSGMGPLTVVALAAFGVRLPRPSMSDGASISAMPGSRFARGTRLDRAVRQFRIGPRSETMAPLALAALLVSGASITVSLLYCERLHDQALTPRS